MPQPLPVICNPIVKSLSSHVVKIHLCDFFPSNVSGCKATTTYMCNAHSTGQPLSYMRTAIYFLYVSSISSVPPPLMPAPQLLLRAVRWPLDCLHVGHASFKSDNLLMSLSTCGNQSCTLGSKNGLSRAKVSDVVPPSLPQLPRPCTSTLCLLMHFESDLLFGHHTCY